MPSGEGPASLCLVKWVSFSLMDEGRMPEQFGKSRLSRAYGIAGMYHTQMPSSVPVSQLISVSGSSSSPLKYVNGPGTGASPLDPSGTPGCGTGSRVSARVGWTVVVWTVGGWTIGGCRTRTGVSIALTMPRSVGHASQNAGSSGKNLPPLTPTWSMGAHSTDRLSPSPGRILGSKGPITSAIRVTYCQTAWSRSVSSRRTTTSGLGPSVQLRGSDTSSFASRSAVCLYVSPLSRAPPGMAQDRVSERRCITMWVAGLPGRVLSRRTSSIPLFVHRGVVSGPRTSPGNCRV